MNIIGLIKEPRWKKIISCTCHGKELDLCLHCKYSEREKSIPKNDFKIKEIKKSIDDKGKTTITEKLRTVKEITIVRGRHQDVIGWTY